MLLEYLVMIVYYDEHVKYDKVVVYVYTYTYTYTYTCISRTVEP